MNLRSIVEGLPCCFSWRDVKLTCFGLAVWNFMFIFFWISGNSVIEMFARLAYCGVILSTLYGIIMSFVYDTHLPLFGESQQTQNEEYISQATVQGIVVKITTIVNSLRNYFVSCTSNLGTLVQFLITMYIIGFVGGIFSLTTWIWLFVDFLFAITFVKAHKGIQVADYIDSIHDVVVGGLTTGLNYIPKYVDEAPRKEAPEREAPEGEDAKKEY